MANFLYIAASLLVLLGVPAAVLFFVIRELLRIDDHPRAGLISGVVVTSLVLLALIVLRPNFANSYPRTSKLEGIISNLRILDAAKHQWALNHHRTGTVEVTREDVAEYLQGPPFEGWIHPVAGEQYVLKTLIESPEATLTRTLEGRPEGTRIRLFPKGRQNLSCEILLPDQ